MMKQLFKISICLSILLTSCFGSYDRADHCDPCTLLQVNERLESEILIYRSLQNEFSTKRTFWINSYEYCQSNNFQNGKAYSVTGNIYSTCSEDVINIDNWIIKKHCLPEVILNDRNVSLFGRWEILNILINDDIMVTPCEAPALIDFSQQDSSYLDYSANITFSNWATGKAKTWNDTIRIIRKCEFANTEDLNDAELEFINAFCGLFSEDTTHLKYSIDKNLLNIKNIENNNQINLYQEVE